MYTVVVGIYTKHTYSGNGTIKFYGFLIVSFKASNFDGKNWMLPDRYIRLTFVSRGILDARFKIHTLLNFYSGEEFQARTIFINHKNVNGLLSVVICYETDKNTSRFIACIYEKKSY